MRATNLEDIVPGLREARAGERQNRALAFSGVTWTVCGRQIVALTPRHRLELQLVRNAFAVGAPASPKDLLQFLWRLSPDFRRNPWPGTGAWFAEWGLARACAGFDPVRATREVYAYLAAMLQDLPEGGAERDTINVPENYVHWMAVEANFYLSRYPSFTLSSFMDTPYLVLQQLYRAHRLEHEEHPNFINESDRLVNEWHRRVAPAQRSGN